MKKKVGAYVLLNKRVREDEFKYTFFDTLLLAARAMYKLANQPNHDKHIHILKYSDYLLLKKHREERTAENLKKCHKIKAIEVEDLDEILNGYKLNLL
ncbi:hypothetical protein [Carboxylicivirga sp. RSCT41]|uniref:hypothetical protein n=1 Tax=Carboxylicivirga agarovorans TaxID=3417570 RepID=UPI003D329807